MNSKCCHNRVLRSFEVLPALLIGNGDERMMMMMIGQEQDQKLYFKGCRRRKAVKEGRLNLNCDDVDLI